MLDVEENIVNIAMMAQKLLSLNAIKQDEMDGYAGLTASIVNLAHQFEEEHGHIDYNAEVKPDEPIPDYWENIDNFAKRHLLELYGVEKAHSLNLQYAYVIMSKAEIKELQEKLTDTQGKHSIDSSNTEKEQIAGYQVTFEDQKYMEIALIKGPGNKPYLDFGLYDPDKNELAHNTTGLPFTDRAIYLISGDTRYKTYLLPFERLFHIASRLQWDARDPDRITGKLECNGALLDKILKHEAKTCSAEYLEKITHGYYPLAFASYNLKTGSVDIAGSLRYMDEGFVEKSHSFQYQLKDKEKYEAMDIMETYAKKTLGCSLREFQNANRQRHELEQMVETITAPIDTEYPCMPLNSKIDTARNRMDKRTGAGSRETLEEYYHEK